MKSRLKTRTVSPPTERRLHLVSSDLLEADVSPSGPTLASSVAGTLRAAIIKGEMAPGTKVNIDRVRDSLGISLSPLREALSRLSSEGFLSFQDKRGYRVTQVSEGDLRQITVLRMDLESLALREAIALGDFEWEQAVMNKLEILNRIVRDKNRLETVEAWENAHRDFHFELLSPCGMPLLIQFAGTLHDLNDRYRRLFLATSNVKRDARAEHLAFAQAAIERRTKDAVTILKQHIKTTGDNIRAALPRLIRKRV
ncbi:MAG TPA: GntR family transcriptional regulator [Steroidobacteraceae bacterium]|jgi:DNA-binding GntR family transcriptional regulator